MRQDQQQQQLSYDVIDLGQRFEGRRGLVQSLISDPNNDLPFYVVDVGDLIYKVKLWKLKMPRVQPYYAVKCNTTPAILELFAGLGLGFDCASKAEIEDVRPYLSREEMSSRIIYANPTKTKSFIRHAAQVGVEMMTFDNEVELYKIKELYPAAKLVLRIRVDDSSSLMSFGAKFGASMERVPDLLRVAKQLELNVMGVSFHVGSGCQEADLFHEAIRDARNVFDQANALGFRMELLDIGGGFPGNKGFQTLFDQISHVVNRSLGEYFGEDDLPYPVRVIAEPGRFFVSSAFVLFTTVIAKRRQTHDIMYYINDGVYGSFSCTIFDHHSPKPIPLKVCAEDEPMFTSSLWGPTCDSMDKICDAVQLPELEVGSWLMFEDMGAYTLSSASLFNGFAKPQVKFVLSSPTVLYLQQFSFWERLVEHFGEAYDEEEEGMDDVTSCSVQAYNSTSGSNSSSPDVTASFLLEQQI